MLDFFILTIFLSHCEINLNINLLTLLLCYVLHITLIMIILKF